MLCRVFINYFVIFLSISITACEDFYQLLGISRDADNRAIRRAFKKLALVKHPDKNPNKENAHKEFVKLNRAYEVLMDDEMRKKYDLYGEEGLSDSSHGGQEYQSWEFYKDNFGIYDEDKEIVTLSRSDFEKTVFQMGENWFINFYSSFCSHCHHLAPVWRQFAREMEGVLRIGAVNCAEDPMLCQSQGVMSYPSLVMYPHRTFFHAERQLDQIIAFAMKYVDGEVVHLKDTDDVLFNSSVNFSLRWLLDFCDQSNDCLSEITRKKLAANLHGLVNVGVVNCYVSPKLCALFGRKNGVVYFQNDGGRKPDEVQEIRSLDFKEISTTVLTYIPNILYLNENLKEIFEAKTRVNAYLIRFSSGEVYDDDLELKKLPVKVDRGIKVHFADCSKAINICKKLSLNKLPKWVLFKKQGYEIYHGKTNTIHDIALFAKESYSSPLVTLTAETYAAALKSDDEWLIDYYAPWCPPCLRLLDELRKLHKYVEKIKIGTVDCEQHIDICNEADVKAYPNIIWYSTNRSYGRTGYIDASSIAEFIKDSRNPLVFDLTPQKFDKLVLHQKKGTIWLVDFYAPWCGPCKQLEPEYKRLARIMHRKEFVHFGMVDCSYYQELCMNLNIQAYPTIRLYSSELYPVDYPSNWWRDHQTMEMWLRNYLPSLIVTVGNDFTTVILRDTKPWLVDFFVTWCSHCIQFMPVFENIAEALDGRVKLAKVNCEQWPSICQKVGVHVYPSVRFYIGARDGHVQDANGIHIQPQDADTIVRFVEKKLHRTDHLWKTEL